MKDLTVLLLILMCIIGIGMWQISYLNESSRYMKTDLNYVDYYINLEKYNEAETQIKNVKNSWENMKDTWSMFIHHDDIEYIEVSLAEIQSYIESTSKEDARARIKTLIANIDYTVDCEKLKLENIF